MSKQKEARSRQIGSLRSLVDHQESDIVETSVHEEQGRKVEIDGEKQVTKLRTQIRQRSLCSQQLALPEWMVEVPSDLLTSGPSVWFVAARPKGRRCIVIACRGRTISRQLNGAVLHRFSSSLPGSGGHGCFTALDCIFVSANKTYYALDVLNWNGSSLIDTTAEFRHYWLVSKLEEVESSFQSKRNEFSIVPVPFFDCDLSGLHCAYFGPSAYPKNGLLFSCKEGHYCGGLTPLILLWKDTSSTSTANNDNISECGNIEMSVDIDTCSSSVDFDEYDDVAFLSGMYSAIEGGGRWLQIVLEVKDMSTTVGKANDICNNLPLGMTSTGVESKTGGKYGLYSQEGCFMGSITIDQVHSMKVQSGDLVRCSLCIRLRNPHSSTYINMDHSRVDVSTGVFTTNERSMTIDNNISSNSDIDHDSIISEYDIISDQKDGYQAYLEIMEVVPIGLASTTCAVADSWTKLVFLAMYSEYPITIQRLMGVDGQEDA